MATIAAGEGVGTATLCNGRKPAREEGRPLPNHDDCSEGWSSRNQFHAVSEKAALNEAGLSASNFCHGFDPEPIRRWRAA